MTDQEIQLLQEENASLKIELEAQKKLHGDLIAESNDLRYKVRVHRAATDVQKRHHEMYRGQYRDASSRCKAGQSGLLEIAELLKRKEPDIAGALARLETTYNDLKTATAIHG